MSLFQRHLSLTSVKKTPQIRSFIISSVPLHGQTRWLLCLRKYCISKFWTKYSLARSPVESFKFGDLEFLMRPLILRLLASVPSLHRFQSISSDQPGLPHRRHRLSVLVAQVCDRRREPDNPSPLLRSVFLILLPSCSSRSPVSQFWFMGSKLLRGVALPFATEPWHTPEIIHMFLHPC